MGRLISGLIFTLLAACSTLSGNVQFDTARASAERITAPQTGDRAALITDNSQFAFDLYHQLALEQSGNLIFSPHSISTAFAMLYAGARGDTASQMAEVLHYNLPQEQLHPAFNALDLSLQPNAQATPLPANDFENPADDLVLNIANSVWAQAGFPFEQPYLETLAQNYGAGVGLLNFSEDPADARETIRRWVEEATEGRIKDVPPQDAITAATRLVLANTVYFKGEWMYPFSSKGTHDAAFYLTDGSEVSVPMMVSDFGFKGCTRFDSYHAIKLDYGASGSAAMLILLPDAGAFQDFEEIIDAEMFQRTIEEVKTTNITQFAMPRFKFESTVNLLDTLSAMGLTTPFSRTADFSGMVALGLSVDTAIHKAVISVDEQGTEAAGVTMVSMAISALVSECEMEVTADRPFIFAIYDAETSAILFLGRVMNPAV